MALKERTKITFSAQIILRLVRVGSQLAKQKKKEIKKWVTYEYLRLSATSESLPSAYSDDRPNSLEPALKLTSNLLGVFNEDVNSQDDWLRVLVETGLGPPLVHKKLAAILEDIFDCGVETKKLARYPISDSLSDGPLVYIQAPVRARRRMKNSVRALFLLEKLSYAWQLKNKKSRGGAGVLRQTAK